jgi:arylsulfatase A-like enzyme
VPLSVRSTLLGIAAWCLGALLHPQDASASPPRTNIVWLVADDLGYADLSLQGCSDIPTPHIDSLAREGVRCTNGYVSAPRCSPTRSGLLTGRYQQRFGCEFDAQRGLGSEVTVAQRLAAAGYVTGAVGKWHLGQAPGDRPGARGFDEFFGFLGGAAAYLANTERGGIVPDILRGDEPANETAYLTDAFAREAVAFLERNKDRPFFLYLAFSAPHRPLEAPPQAVERFASISDPSRRTYAAMVSSMDDAVGAVLAKLHTLGLDERTLVVFLNDNGGPLGKKVWNGSSNAPLRGGKSSTYDGGVRVPFLVRWPKTLPAGASYDAPISSIDLAPTALAAAGVPIEPAWQLDGVDLLPFLTGHTAEPPHEALFWRFNWPPAYPALHKWAIRMGDWKLVHSPTITTAVGEMNAPPRLYDLASDPEESVDRAAENPEVVQALQERWNEWNATLPPPPAPQASGTNDEASENED